MSSTPIILGTAGHIDHGKTALVQALTGIDTDRLKVEKERGITTELGFAHLDLDGRRYGFVDVPGHERFIRAMVSGAMGIDLVCLVIAADEGIMPQTREHLDICQLLGVRTGFVALSKADLGDSDWLAMVEADVRDALDGTFLADAKIIPCSAKTGSGLDDVRSEIIRIARNLSPRPTDSAFRLPIDRVFTIKGFGTVVTGTVFDGEVSVKDSVLVQPGGQSAKVRGLQVHGDDVDSARAGTRCAVNLAGVGTSDIHRGDVLSHPGAIVPSHILDVRLRYLGTSLEPLRSRKRVIVHHATTQVLGTVTLLDQAELEPGGEALAQLRIDRETPLCATPGDRFLLRGFVPQEHYGTTIGGGDILRVQAAKLKPKTADTEALAALEHADIGARIVHEVHRASHRGLAAAELGQRIGRAADDISQHLDKLVDTGELVRAAHSEGERVLMSPDIVARLEKSATDLVAEHRKKHADGEGMPTAELREKLPAALPAPVFDLMLRDLARRGAIEVDGALIRHTTAKTTLSPLAEDLEKRFREWGVTPKRPAELPQETGKPRQETDRALQSLARAELLTKVKSDLYVHSGAIATLKAGLEAHLDERAQITPAEWKAITGASRKYSIPLAEYFDGIKLTLRVGDIRKRRG